MARTGLLEVLPGVGTVVSANWRTTPEERDQLLSQELERLAVEAARLGLTEAELLSAVRARWAELFAASPAGTRVSTAGPAGTAARPRTPVSGD